MQDITPDLLEAVERSFRSNLGKNKRIKTLQKALEDGKATYHEADQYAVEVGQELAKAFRKHISSDTLPDGKMYYNIASRVIPPPLRASFEEIADFAETMQRGMNERAKLGIKAVRPKYNAGREEGLIEYAVQADQYDSIRRSFEEDLINFGQAVVTDALRENAEFQYGAGLSPVIRRTTNGGCCDWCSKLAGTYPYEDVRDTGNDVYRRHRSCRCRIVFDPGEGKVQNVHTKRWEEKRDDRIDRANKESSVYREKSEKEKAKRIELASGGNRGIIKGEKGLDRQDSNSIRRSIRKIEKSKKEHEDKIKNPEKYIPNWNEKNDQYKRGILEYWRKEIVEKDRAIQRRKNKLKERGKML